MSSHEAGTCCCTPAAIETCQDVAAAISGGVVDTLNVTISGLADHLDCTESPYVYDYLWSVLNGGFALNYVSESGGIYTFELLWGESGVQDPADPIFMKLEGNPLAVFDPACEEHEEHSAYGIRGRFFCRDLAGHACPGPLAFNVDYLTNVFRQNFPACDDTWSFVGSGVFSVLFERSNPDCDYHNHRAIATPDWRGPYNFLQDQVGFCSIVDEYDLEISLS